MSAGLTGWPKKGDLSGPVESFRFGISSSWNAEEEEEEEEDIRSVQISESFRFGISSSWNAEEEEEEEEDIRSVQISDLRTKGN